MRHILFTIITTLITVSALAQTDTVVTTTTTTTTTNSTTVSNTTVSDTVVKAKRKSLFNFKGNRDTIKTVSKAPGFSWGPTLSRIDVGLATLIDNGSTTLSPQNEFLRYRSWKSSNFGFDFIQVGYRFSSSFKIYVSGGFDWTKFRLREDVTLQRFQPSVTYTQDDVEYSKNNFSFTYFRIPLTFYWRGKDDDSGHRVHLAGGPIMGILINGHTKQKSEENGTQKYSAGYNLAKVRYGGFVRVGYAGLGVFAKYYLNDMFANSPAQKGLRNLSVGLTVGF